MTNFTNKQVGTAQADKVYLPAYPACVAALRNDEVRTLGHGIGWMHGSHDALAQDASNRNGSAVRHHQRSVWMSWSASPFRGRQIACRGPHRVARFSVVKTPSILCIVRSLGVIPA